MLKWWVSEVMNDLDQVLNHIVYYRMRPSLWICRDQNPFPENEKSKTSGWRVSGLISSRNVHYQFSWFHPFSPTFQNSIMLLKFWRCRRRSISRPISRSFMASLSSRVSMILAIVWTPFLVNLLFFPKTHATRNERHIRYNRTTLTDLAKKLGWLV